MDESSNVLNRNSEKTHFIAELSLLLLNVPHSNSSLSLMFPDPNTTNLLTSRNCELLNNLPLIQNSVPWLMIAS
jgi:hypothetical protein